jgi:hypothetical protein
MCIVPKCNSSSYLRFYADIGYWGSSWRMSTTTRLYKALTKLASRHDRSVDKTASRMAAWTCVCYLRSTVCLLCWQSVRETGVSLLCLLTGLFCFGPLHKPFYAFKNYIYKRHFNFVLVSISSPPNLCETSLPKFSCFRHLLHAIVPSFWSSLPATQDEE